MSDTFKLAVVEFLGSPSAVTADRVCRFAEAVWRAHYRWLDQSGVALYVAHALQRIDSFVLLPEEVQKRLLQNQSDSVRRAEGLFAEFARIVSAFQKTGRPFVVHKGFALVPEYCEHAALRTQCDFDLQILKRDLAAFTSALNVLGYHKVLQDDDESVFETSPEAVLELLTIYKPRPSFRAELHYGDVGFNHVGELPLDMPVVSKCLNGVTFPSVDIVDQFMHQAGHTFQHFRIGWIRLSSLYEVLTFVRGAGENTDLWATVQRRCEAHPEIARNVAFTFCLLECCFGLPSGNAFEQLLQRLGRASKVWIQNFGREFLLADFPGTKLQLLLAKDPNERVEAVGGYSLHKFVPVRKAIQRGLAAMRMLVRNRNTNSREVRYIRGRFMFHARENVRFLVARRKWIRALQSAQEKRNAVGDAR